MLERVRNIKREDMEYTNENGYSVKVVLDPILILAQDIFHRFYLSDVKDQHLTAIFPNQWPAIYMAVAEMTNKYNVNCRNVDAFSMDEWANEDDFANRIIWTYFYGMPSKYYASWKGYVLCE